MKIILSIIAFCIACSAPVHGQSNRPTEKQKKDISTLIDEYSRAREEKDTILLKDILTKDVDQLVSTGEWRDGIAASVKGMLSSSATSPGTRTLTVEKIRLLNQSCALVDCRYEIQNADGSPRRMWSTFVIVAEKGKWKISAIRNMLPTRS